MNAYLRAMRLERWPRSTAIFAGTAALYFLRRDIFGGLGIIEIAARLAGSFLVTWFISTANYIINEVADAPFDIHHPTKRNRPLVKGEVRTKPLLAWAVVLGVPSFLVAGIFFSREFLFSLLALLAAGFIYNIKPVRTKDVPFIDAVSESMNNPIRFLIGWYAFPVRMFPPWSLLIAWWAFGNFLMIAKRLSEFRFLKERAADYRASLKRYTMHSLVLGMAVSAAVFFLGYFYFAVSCRLQLFILISPLLAFYFYLFFRKTLHETEVMEEPERLLGRPKFALYTVFLFLLYLAAVFLDKIGR
ncbi:MAG TPA: UbiA family prenyltransferase [Candidatus Aminicenantes bacterium]|nr:UbiA family prenyltransferase [Acidobacteriota bacterium]HOI44270.1 UbiA family prenyltransferase [Candidatus Aminicenantes bacterium]